MMISCLNVEINAFEHFTRDGHVTKTSSSFVCLFIQFYVHRNSTCLNLFVLTVIFTSGVVDVGLCSGRQS